MKRNILYAIIIFFTFSLLGIKNVSAYEPSNDDMIFYGTFSQYYEIFFSKNENKLYVYCYSSSSKKKLNEIHSLDIGENKYIAIASQYGDHAYPWISVSNSPMYLNINDNKMYNSGDTVIYGFDFKKLVSYKKGDVNRVFSPESGYTLYPGYDILYSDGNLYKKANFKMDASLQYKSAFTSNEESGKISKISVEFNENDSSISSYNKSLFKLQFGSNDWTKENIPVFSHFRVYGKRNDNSQWESLTDKNLKFETGETCENNVCIATYEDITFKVIDTTFEYVEGSIADASITLEMKFLESLNTPYSNWKIEFYFDNIDNGFFYTYDSLKETTSSSWSKTKEFLADYNYYYFPSNYKYAFITSNNLDNKGQVYYTTNATINNLVQIQPKYYDYASQIFSSPIDINTYDNDTYFSYSNFEFNGNDKVLVLNRIRGSMSYTNYYDTNALTLALDTFLKMMSGGHFSFYEQIEQNEMTYFYVPIGYNVYFTDGLSDTVIATPDGFITIDKNITADGSNSDQFEVNENDTTNKKYKNKFDEFVANFRSHFPIIEQLTSYINNLFTASYSDTPPSYKITIYGVTVDIINWLPFEIIKTFFQIMIIFFSWSRFLIYLFHSIPSLIKGQSIFNKYKNETLEDDIKKNM